jgi:hypothetical protein
LDQQLLLTISVSVVLDVSAIADTGLLVMSMLDIVSTLSQSFEYENGYEEDLLRLGCVLSKVQGVYGGSTFGRAATSRPKVSSCGSLVQSIFGL